MGTTTQWIQVVIAALVYAGGMLYWKYRERKVNSKPIFSPSSFETNEGKIGPKPALAPLLILFELLIGWAIGVFVVFPFRQAFSWPLVMIMLGPLLAFFVLGLCTRKLPRSSLIGWHPPKQ